MSDPVRPTTRSAPSRPMLYDGRDVTQLVVRGGLGLLLIAVGWYQAGDRLLLDDQAPWLALAVGGLAVACLSGALWIMQLRRAVSIRAAALRRVAGAYLAVELLGAPVVDDDTAALVAPAASAARFFHRRDCVLVADRDTVAASEEDHRNAGRIPCEACLVDERPRAGHG